VRCLPNPYYEPLLRELTGLDAKVAAFLEAEQATQNMYRDIHAFIATWLPAFVRENRSYLTVAIGCTGGQHRSVYFAERLGAAFRDGNQVMIRHRQVR
jgi:RNase adapter protein RapZ